MSRVYLIPPKEIELVLISQYARLIPDFLQGLFYLDERVVSEVEDIGGIGVYAVTGSTVDD